MAIEAAEIDRIGGIERIISHYQKKVVQEDGTFASEMLAKVDKHRSNKAKVNFVLGKMSAYAAEHWDESRYYDYGNIIMLAMWARVGEKVLPLTQTGWLLVEGMERFARDQERIAFSRSAVETRTTDGLGQIVGDAKILRSLLPQRTLVVPQPVRTRSRV